MTADIYRIPSERMDSNSYLVEEEGHGVIIDGSACRGVLEEVSRRGLTVDYLLLTHEHFDHIWFLEDLRKAYGMPVVACRLCSERMQDVKTNLSNISDLLYYFKTGVMREGRSRSFTCKEADIVYEDSFCLDWRGHRFDFCRLPGHSPGSVTITMDQGNVFTGDYLIQGEEEITRLKGGSQKDYEFLARPWLEGIPEGSRIFPGHGPAYVKGETGDVGQAEEEAAAAR